MNKTTTNKIRNGFHFFTGIVIVYLIAHLTGMFEYNGIVNHICISIACFPFITFFGIAYEKVISMIDKEQIPDLNDAFRMGFGGLTGGLLTIFPYNGYVLLTGICICLIVTGIETNRLINKK